jgi:hypothetical protein
MVNQVFDMDKSERIHGGKSSLFDFGWAKDQMAKGQMVSRTGWHGGDMFVFMQIPAVIPKAVVPKMQSLPQSVKDKFQSRFDDEKKGIDSISYSNQMGIVFPNNEIKGWAPSVSDTLANDWFLYR